MRTGAFVVALDFDNGRLDRRDDAVGSDSRLEARSAMPPILGRV
jgi:hypothetical protein